MEINKGWWLLPRPTSSACLSRTVHYILCIHNTHCLVLKRLYDHLLYFQGTEKRGKEVQISFICLPTTYESKLTLWLYNYGLHCKQIVI